MLKSKKNIILIGMMGCGKTTIARLLKDQLKMNWIDMDIYIEDKYQMRISEMFDISERCDNIKALRQNGYIIYVDRPIPLILEDIDTSSRPLLKDGAQRLYELYQKRHPLYLKACDYHVDNDGTLEEICTKIILKLKEL